MNLFWVFVAGLTLTWRVTAAPERDPASVYIPSRYGDLPRALPSFPLPIEGNEEAFLESTSKERLPRMLVWVKGSSPKPVSTTTPVPVSGRFAYLEGIRDALDSRKNGGFRPHEYLDAMRTQLQIPRLGEAARMSLLEYLLALFSPPPPPPTTTRPPPGVEDDGPDYVDDVGINSEDNYYDADEQWIKELIEAQNDFDDVTDGNPAEVAKVPDLKPDEAKPGEKEPAKKNDRKGDKPKKKVKQPEETNSKESKIKKPKVEAPKPSDDASRSELKAANQSSPNNEPIPIDIRQTSKEVDDSVALLKRVISNVRPSVEKKARNSIERQGFSNLGYGGIGGLFDPMLIITMLYQGVSQAGSQLIDAALKDPHFQAKLQEEKKRKQKIQQETLQRRENFEESNELNLKFQDSVETVMSELGREIDQKQTFGQNSVTFEDKMKKLPSKLNSNDQSLASNSNFDIGPSTYGKAGANRLKKRQTTKSTL